jgi:phage shock protein PspC (stress-responsive transcriptional regulator)
MTNVNGLGGQQGVFAEEDKPAAAGWPDTTPPGRPPARRLERKTSGRWVAGVCEGIAAYAGVDPTVVRLAFAVLSFFGGIGLAAYVIGWALIPEEGDSASIAERFITKNDS